MSSVENQPKAGRPRSSRIARLRRWHRWLGVTIGLQFLAWTAGGLYFSWSDIDEVHGDDLRTAGPTLPDGFAPALLDPIVEAARHAGLTGRVERVAMRPLVDGAVYHLVFSAPAGPIDQLADARTGALRPPLSPAEAEALARATYGGTGRIASSGLLETAGPHHEYRGLPLPAWAFTFDDSRRTRIYVAPAEGRVTSVRNSRWRVFDFLWMLHTMDYAGRDNLNNWLLRVFAVFGLSTLASGFALFFATQRRRSG